MEVVATSAEVRIFCIPHESGSDLNHNNAGTFDSYVNMSRGFQIKVLQPHRKVKWLYVLLFMSVRQTTK